jgi:hypothetical protein
MPKQKQTTNLWLQYKDIIPKKYQSIVFGIVVGLGLTMVLLWLHSHMFTDEITRQPFVLTALLLFIAATWRFLFGPWNVETRATVLGTCIVVLMGMIIYGETTETRAAYLLSIAVAIIPAVLWCVFFLHEHRQRFSLVLLTFFAGMLATGPILFYDSLVKGGMQFHFLLFRVIPENFNQAASSLVSSLHSSPQVLYTTMISMLVSFLIVGFIEEVSKFWVLSHSGKSFCQSIDDVLQLSIVAAIGFACAENVLNPSYFVGFVNAYVLEAAKPDWMSLLGNVLGRSILTNMVHIISTGIIGFALGYSMFARAYLKDERHKGTDHSMLSFFSKITWIPEPLLFKGTVITLGLTASVITHGVFNFIVSLPSILPGNPSSLADAFGMSGTNILSFIPILLIPSLIYVVGGLWLLTYLFSRRSAQKEHGRVVSVSTFVRD